MTKFIFELAVSRTMQRLGELTQARDRQLKVALDKGGALDLWIPLGDPLAARVEEAATSVLIKMDNNGTVTPIWSGPVWNAVKSRPQKRLQIGCVGWLETFRKRVTKPWWVDPAGALTYTNHDAGLIAQDFVRLTNADPVGGVPTYVVPGTTELTQPRTRTYQPWSNVLGEIEALSEIESGYDMAVHPLTRALNIYTKLQTIRPTLGFEYGANVNSVTTTTNVDRMCNRLIAYSSIGYAIAEDQDSMRAYGVFEEAVSLSDVVDIEILQAFANAEVAIRSTPMEMHNFGPRASSKARPKDPMIFRDFNIGDIGRFKLADSIDTINQAVRLFAATVDFKNNGSVQLSDIQTTAS